MITKREFLAAAAAAPLLGTASRGWASDGFFVRDNRLFLDVAVNGHPVRALLDSAAEMSFVDATFARAIGLVGGETVGAHGSGGDEDAQLAKGVMIDALGLHLGPSTVAVLDLSDIGRRLLNGSLSFIMGRELFDAARLYIDIDRNEIRTLPPDSTPPGTQLQLSTERGLETFPASVEGHASVATAFDLGNGSDVLIGAAYADELGVLTDGRPVTEKMGGGIGGERRRKVLTLKSLSIAGRQFANVPAAIDATSTATRLNVGVSILRHFEIVTDFPAQKIWLNSR